MAQETQTSANDANERAWQKWLEKALNWVKGAWPWPKKALNWGRGGVKNYWPFLLALALYAGSYVFQSGAVLRDAPLQYHEIIKIPSQVLEVSVTYPQRLRVDNGQVAAAIITLRHTQPVSPTLAYAVNWILPPEAIILTNQEGERITGRFVLTPTMQYPASVTFNVQRVLSTKSALPPLQPILLIQTPTELLATRVLPVINTLSLCKIWWFGFWNLVFGPATPLISAAAGLMVLAVKKIQDLASKRLKDAENREQIRAELLQWETLLQRNLSEGARQYVQYRQRNEGIWKVGKLGQQELRRIWERQDSQLRDAVAVLEVSDDPQPEAANLVPALKWVQANLDEEWRAKAFSELLKQSHAETEEHLFYNMLRVWPQCSFGHKLQLDSSSPERVLAVLTTISERDGLWFQSRFIQANWFTELRDLCPVWAYGPPGCGKTTAALWLLRETARRDSDDFNVYCSLTRVTGISNLEDIARAVAHTLLHYFALYSTAFLQLDWRTQYTLTQLWRQYAGPDVRAALYTAGLSPYGEGVRLLKRVNALLADTSLAPTPLTHLSGRLSDVCPRGFSRLTLLLDIQESKTLLTEPVQDALLQLGETLQYAGIGVKILVSGNSFDVELPLRWHRIKLIWTEDDLSALLVELKIKSIDPQDEGMDSIDPWCDPDATGLNAETRLLSAAQGTPRGLLQKLIALQQRIKKNNAPLSAQDMDDILGPLSASEENGNA